MQKNFFKYIIFFIVVLNIVICCFNNCFASVKLQNNLNLIPNDMYLLSFNEKIINYKLSSPQAVFIEKNSEIYNENKNLILKTTFKPEDCLLFVQTKESNYVFNISVKKDNKLSNTDNTFSIIKVDNPPLLKKSTVQNNLKPASKA